MAPRRPKAAGAAPARAQPGRRPVLVTGFEPFGGEDINPSWEICRALPAAIGRSPLETLLVPTQFRRAIEVVAEAIERTDPTLVILLGQAGGRACVSVERVAINIDDARIADNAGARPIDEPVAAAGPPAYFATVPIKAMVAAIRDAGIPAEVSNSAGTFVCNHLFYGTLHYLAASGRDARAGFIHVPWLESQAVSRPGEPAMALATMVRGVEAAIAAALATAEDVKMAAGQLD
ncbi:MAG: pyroglutamyl-peptidase I [Betaproteobacteria bacterium]|nr:MAG: pyroglutamyl-peptidase I [Betaproteobacteria bacterium]